MMAEKRWGDYYFGRRRDSWALELVNKVNDALPKFTDIFDRDTFYLTAFIFVLSSFALAFLLSRFVTLRPREP